MSSMTYTTLSAMAALAFGGALLAGCTSSPAHPATLTTGNSGTLSASPSPAVAGQQITISESVFILNTDHPSASWIAVRDGNTTVASGTLNQQVGGGPVPLSFTDTILMPGMHHYAVTLTVVGSDNGSQALLDLPVLFDLTPSMQVSSNSTTGAMTLTLTLANTGSGNVAFIVPYTVTDSQGLASGALQSFNFTSEPLAPGSSRAQTISFGLPASGNDTYTFTVDPQRSLGTNLAGSPVTVSLPFGTG